MKDEFIVKGAMATCQFGVAPAMLSNIMDNMNVYYNGKLAATSMSLGPVFQAPAFGTCNMVPNMPKPCAAVITKWDNVFMGGMKINRISSPLTKDSKGTCALGCPMCISFTTTGQLPIPSVPLPEVVKVEHQSDMNPLAGNDENRERVQAKDATGLTPEEKEILKKDPPGWSDEIVDQLISMDEANIYLNADLKEVEVNGKACLIRKDIDLDCVVDDRGRTNRQRMAKGLAPLDANGDSVELHHIGQKSDAGLAELTNDEHHKGGNDTVLHDKKKKSEIDRKEFDTERSDHWKSRYKKDGETL